MLQSFSTMVIKSKQKNFKPRFLLEILFSVLYTYAKSVRQVKTKIYMRATLLYADAVQLLTTENVYLGKTIFSFYFLLNLLMAVYIAFRFFFASLLYSREITSELNCDEETPQRTWEKLLPYNRILIYCL